MSDSKKILIIDDDRFVRMSLREAAMSWGYHAIEAGSLKEAEESLAAAEPEVVLLDIDLPDGSGLELLDRLKNERPETVVIMITGDVSVENTVAALRGGAYDFIGKPIKLEELQVTLRNAVETRLLRSEVKTARKKLAAAFDFENVIGESAAMKKAVELSKRVAESDVLSILLQGETGTGKDVFARAIHYASPRANANYIAINCAALPATLIESELFGHEKGAFTDAKQRKEGLFEQARDGTIFLDEIGEMELQLQAKLLRVLESNTFRRVGGLSDIPMNVRIIAASNKNLKEEAEKGNFRMDLYYRLSIIQIDIPPLREREGDTLLLAKYFIDKANQKPRAVKLKWLSPEAESVFVNYEWTGNVRELRNVIERASILEDGEYITPMHFPADMLSVLEKEMSPGIMLPVGGLSLEELEADLARQAYERTGGNMTKAAKLLDISRDQLRYKLNKSLQGQTSNAGEISDE